MKGKVKYMKGMCVLLRDSVMVRKRIAVGFEW